MTKATKPKDKSVFEWFFSHKDMITALDYLVHNDGKTVNIEDMEKHLGFSDYYLKNNILKHLTATKIIKKTTDGYKFTTSQASKSFLKLNEELERVKAELPVPQPEPEDTTK